MLLPHNKVSGGVQDSQIMIPSFFDRFYVMPPLTNGVHYNFLPSYMTFAFAAHGQCMQWPRICSFYLLNIP